MSENPKARTVLDLLNRSAGYLSAKGSKSPRLDAEVLLADVLGCSRIQLYVGFDKRLEECELEAYRSAVIRRGRREPVAYITGRKEFMGREFAVSPEVLVPRPDTELLAEKGIEAARKRPASSVLDLCCGSGVVGITIAIEVPDARVLLADLSAGALAKAAMNVVSMNVTNASTAQGDLFRAVPEHMRRSLDVIVSNPPYIRTDAIDSLEAEIAAHEPRLALDGGEDGLDFYRRIASEARIWLKAEGSILLEVGHGQAEAVGKLLSDAGFSGARFFKDLAGFDRVVAATA